MRNEKREFDELEKQALGSYVYCLRNPLDNNRIFYVGKGGGDGKGNDRVFAHFNDAEKAEKDTDGIKLQTIRNIWRAGHDVDVYFVRRQIKSEEEALNIEAALIDGLRISANGNTEAEDGNKVLGHGKENHGCLSLSELREKAADPVNPKINGEIRVFVFSLNQSLGTVSNPSEEDLYEATRKAWLIKPPQPEKDVSYYAVGVRKDVALSAYRIKVWSEWKPDSATSSNNKGQKRYEFEGDGSDSVAAQQLKLKSWKGILEEVKKWRMRAGRAIPEVAFYGDGKYMHLRGPASVKGKLRRIDCP